MFARRAIIPLHTGVIMRNVQTQSFFGRLLSNVKGFKNFYPKRGSSDPKGNTASGGKGGSGGGGGNKPNMPPSRMIEISMYLSVTAAILLFTMSSSKDLREIDYQQFQNQLLASGVVDRVIVTNKETARVVLRSPTPVTPTSTNSSVESNRNSTGFEFGNDINGGSQKDSDMYGASGFTSTFSTEEPVSTQDVPAAIVAKDTGMSNATAAAISPYWFSIGSVDSFENKLTASQRDLGIPPSKHIPVVYTNETNWAGELLKLAPTLMLVGLAVVAMRGAAGAGGGPGGIFKVGKSKAKKILKENVNVTFADVAGCDEAKTEIMEFVEFLKNPKKFTDLGAKIPKGAMICGPPGTGKTLLAKATAGEANVPFFTVSGSEFVEMFVGVGAARVRDLFKEARAAAPCIIFIDEIDAVGKARSDNSARGGNDERESTLNQLLVEMDGFDSMANIVVLAGTNRIDVLDKALLRPGTYSVLLCIAKHGALSLCDAIIGRFDRQITVDKPDIKGRKAIFEIYLKKLQLDGVMEAFSARLSSLTPGFSGADISNICNEAAIIAARRDKKIIDLNDFESATDRVVGGLESKKIMGPEERKLIAYHEAGHAVAGWNLEHADPLLKVTIIPRSSGALGYAQYLPKEVALRTRAQLLDIVCMALAGRAAEEVNFGYFTTGASDDLKKVTNIVYQMVQVYGMNDKIGQVSFPGEQNTQRLHSDATCEAIDHEVRAIVDEAYERTLELMRERKDQVILVGELLLAQETISHADVAKLIGKRPFSTDMEYQEFVDISWEKPVTNSETDQPASTEEGNATAVVASADDNKDKSKPPPVAEA